LIVIYSAQRTDEVMKHQLLYIVDENDFAKSLIMYLDNSLFGGKYKG
jgi:hypothetical protein